MNATSTIDRSPPAVQSHGEFLELVPTVERHVKFAFRSRPVADQEEAAAEAVAAAYASYVGLKARGKDPVRDFPSSLVAYAVLHVRVGRQMGSRNSSTDVMSPLAQRKRGFKLEALQTSPGIARDHLIATADRTRCDEFDEQLRDNTRSPVPEQAAFRIDFPEFLIGLGRRNRTLARFLALGHAGHVAAARFGLTAGRVSQLRSEWREQWRQSQGEDVDGRSRDRDADRS